MTNIMLKLKEKIHSACQIPVAPTMRTCLGIVLALLLVSPMPGSAYTLDTSASPSAVNGLWWNPNESGWGANFIQQYDVIFATIYTYDPSGNPVWYVASDCSVSGSGCQGDLYAVAGGSSLTAPWNGNNKTVTPVGSITLLFTDNNHGTMNFTINGVPGSKIITRQVWRTSSAATQFPLASALSNIYKSPHNITLSAQDGPDFFTIQYIQTPGAASTFQGQPASTLAQIGTFSVNGAIASAPSGVLYFSSSPFEQLGYVSSGQFQAFSNQQTLPAYATVGQSGSLDTYIVYTDSSESLVSAVGTETWSLSSDTPTTAWACINDSQTLIGSALSVFSTCYKIDTAGNFLAMRYMLPVGGTTLVFQ